MTPDYRMPCHVCGNQDCICPPTETTASGPIAPTPAPSTSEGQTPPETRFDKLQGQWRVDATHVHQQIAEAKVEIRTLERELASATRRAEEAEREREKWAATSRAMDGEHAKTIMERDEALAFQQENYETILALRKQIQELEARHDH